MVVGFLNECLVLVRVGVNSNDDVDYKYVIYIKIIKQDNLVAAFFNGFISPFVFSIIDYYDLDTFINTYFVPIYIIS